MFLFKLFNGERSNTKNKEPSIFAEEAYSRSSGFENKADDCPDKTRKNSRDLFSKFLESVSDPCATVLSPFVSEFTITPITVPTARNTPRYI